MKYKEMKSILENQLRLVSKHSGLLKGLELLVATAQVIEISKALMSNVKWSEDA